MRSDKRERERKIQKLNKKVNKLTDTQVELIDLYAQQKADQLLDVFKDLVTESMFKAMRMNRVGQERAERIIEKANEIMNITVNESKGVNK